MTWIVCVALMLLQAAAAYPIAVFYGDTRLALPIALMGTIYLATPVSNIQGAFIQREGRMGRIAFTGALQVVADNILTAVLALCGLGMWAILLPKLFKYCCNCLTLLPVLPFFKGNAAGVLLVVCGVPLLSAIVAGFCFIILRVIS